MRVPFPGATVGLRNDDGADMELSSGGNAEHLLEELKAGENERFDELANPIEPGAEKVRHGENDMSIDNTRKKALRNKVDPSVGVWDGTGEAEGTFTGKGDLLGVTTVKTPILSKAHFLRFPAIEHFLNDFIVVFGVVAWI